MFQTGIFDLEGLFFFISSERTIISAERKVNLIDSCDVLFAGLSNLVQNFTESEICFDLMNATNFL